MMGLVARLVETYSQQHVLREQRIAAGQQPNLPFTSPQFIFYANVFYLGFAFLLARFMMWRKRPLQCSMFKTILAVYNLSCVVLAAYVVWGIVSVMMARPFRFVCNKTLIPGQDEGTGHAEFLAHVYWVFYAQKFWEFFDTWFFIMRMSFRQVTFLHVFHHCSINIVVGLIIPFEFSGDMYLPILLNAIVHTLMYSHYLATIMKVKAPWRPFLTSLQLTQFVLIATQSAMSLYAGDECGAPYFSKFGMVLYMGSMLVLFGNFFIRAYIVKSPSARFGDGVVMRVEPIMKTHSYSGRVALDASGAAVVELPQLVWKDGEELSYQVTPIGKPMPQLHVSREPNADKRSFELSGGVAGFAVSWCVTHVVYILGEPPKRNPAPLSCCGGDSGNPQSCCGPPGGNQGKKEQ